jgi:pyruvate dehydrogenase E1 component beta subunit
MKAVSILASHNISAELIDLRTISPLDEETILTSVKKTGRLVVCDQGHLSAGFASEIVARISEKAFSALKAAPQRIALPDCPTPTTRALSNYFYPLPDHIVNAVLAMFAKESEDPYSAVMPEDKLDVFDSNFKGPF